MRQRAAIVGLAGPVLSAEEASLLRSQAPVGVILFGRNVRDPAQLRDLIRDIRGVMPPGALVLVDQEGGRVARLRRPHWRAHPAAGRIGELHGTRPDAARRLAWLTGALIGLECAAVGFDVVCAPVMDLRLPDRSDVVGDRGYHADPAVVASLARAMADGLLAAGLQPVMKHLPGHGQARVDSHAALPVVDDPLDEDLVPFARNHDLPWAMTAHVLYPSLDPARPATVSPAIIGRVIREQIGFRGVLVSDDLAMGALAGRPAERAAAALAAGCDLAMYCAGDLVASEAVLRASRTVTDAVLARLAAAQSMARAGRQRLNADSLAAEREALLT